jgi:hypothetical protein
MKVGGLAPDDSFPDIFLHSLLYADTHLRMRTTIDIEDDLAIRAKKEAVERRCSLKALVEQGLELVLKQKQAPAELPIEMLAGLGKEIWEGVNADRYVRDSRKGWR